MRDRRPPSRAWPVDARGVRRRLCAGTPRALPGSPWPAFAPPRSCPSLSPFCESPPVLFSPLFSARCSLLPYAPVPRPRRRVHRRRGVARCVARGTAVQAFVVLCTRVGGSAGAHRAARCGGWCCVACFCVMSRASSRVAPVMRGSHGTRRSGRRSPVRVCACVDSAARLLGSSAFRCSASPRVRRCVP